MSTAARVVSLPQLSAATEVLVQDKGKNPPPNSDTCESEPEPNRIFVRPR